MMDFKSLIKDSDLYNFHSHTQFCDGRAPMAEFAAEAVGRGFTHYGFSPHSPIYIPSPCNMSTGDVAPYKAEYQRLKDLYADSTTTFYMAMEVDYLGRGHGPSSSYYADLGLDYIIGSVHFVPTRKGELIDIDGRFENFLVKMHRYFNDDVRYVVMTYFDRIEAMVDAGGFDIIGHFDKVRLNASHFLPDLEQQPWFIDRLNQVVDTVIASGVAIEINTKAYADHGRFFPDASLWSKIKHSGATILVNSDAHRPELIDASRRTALDILSNL
ncbi:MAG: histidinol-phosphatase [Bacteroides sp.]|nr:histidinol-phosphatase [Bacteroides sp.]MCM1412839.1 histidinol-phosphatase [Bacteroides sp.]MCM1471508.1 histidinol-phosphatase [Bacteroides sp.]